MLAVHEAERLRSLRIRLPGLISLFALDRTGGESLSNLAPSDNGQQEDRQRDDETSCLRVQG